MRQPNKEMFAKVMNKILTEPKCWDQGTWHCGTTHCFAGLVEVESDDRRDRESTRECAMRVLNISEDLGNYLFDAYRSLTDLYRTVAKIVSGEMNADGIDKEGRNCSGFMTNELIDPKYNIYGYDAEGYRRNGFNRAGIDRDGWHQDGINYWTHEKRVFPLLEVPVEV